MIEAIKERARKKQTPYILPTGSGAIFIGVFFTLFLMGLVYGNNLTLLLAFCMFAFLIGIMFKTHEMVKRYSHISIHLSDGASAQIKTNLLGNFHIELQSSNQTLKAQSGTGTFQINAKRGRYPIKVIKVWTSGEWGLFKVWRYVPGTRTLFVYPRLEQVEKSYFRELHQDGAEAFHQHKRYERGQASKRIDWKVYAKKEELLVRDFKENKPDTIEINEKHLKGDFESKVSKMAWLVNKAHSEGMDWELKLNKGTYLAFSRGVAHFKKSMEILSEA
ncbi:MAG: hypothetical protein CME67_07695 [Halobacteriovoraceae bacterium]|nr:hypothetical protein [Halobacteriovoraceae bacterium]|tara:strand:+ start:691 stop:1518 length:828 start_codon:yes stop_codon:yes gene_type:complete